MWVIYFQGKPTYWLQCDKLYTIGRKDTDVVILEDNSISRLHMNVSVGQVGTVAGMGRHMLQQQRGGGGGGMSDASATGSRSPSRSIAVSTSAATALEADNLLADRVAAVLGSVTSASELAALYPSAPLSFQDLSKYGSTVEYVMPASSCGGGGGATPSAPASHSHTPSAVAATSAEANTISVRMKKGSAVTAGHAEGGSAGLGHVITNASNDSGEGVDATSAAGTVTLSTSLHRCRLRVGTHEAIFEFRWEPFFILLGQTEGGGNSTSTTNTNTNNNPRDQHNNNKSSSSTHDWVMRSIAKCGYIVLNAKVDAALAARQLKEMQQQQQQHLPLPPSSNTAIAIVPHLELPAHILRMCSFLLTAEINPTPLLMAAMCAGKPIVGLQFLENALSRVSPKVPLPEPTSTLAIPKKIHVFFSQLIGGTADTSADQLLSSSFVARSERSRLFSLTTFVAIQKPVYDELKSYVPLGDGHIVFDEYLAKAVAILKSCLNHNNNTAADGAVAVVGGDGGGGGAVIGEGKAAQQQRSESPSASRQSISMENNHQDAKAALSALIAAFYARHGNRVLVYLPPKLPPQTAASSSSPSFSFSLPPEITAVKTIVDTLSGRSHHNNKNATATGGGMRMPTVEYTSLLSAIVRARRLDIPQYNNNNGNAHHHHSHSHKNNGGAIGLMGSGILGQKRSRSRSAGGGGEGGRRTENGNIFGDFDDTATNARMDAEEIDIDATIDPASSNNKTQHKHYAAHNNSSSGNGVAVSPRLLVASSVALGGGGGGGGGAHHGLSSHWKSRDELRAQTSAVLLPDGSRMHLSSGKGGAFGGNLDDDDEDDLLLSGGGGHRSNGGAAATMAMMASHKSASSASSYGLQGSTAVATAMLATATSRAQLVAFDPLSGALGGGVSANQQQQQQRKDDNGDDGENDNPLEGPNKIRKGAVVEDDSLIIATAAGPALPPYPCFQKWYIVDGNNNDNNNPAAAAIASNSSGKTFKKQFVPQPTRILELEPEPGTAAPRHATAQQQALVQHGAGVGMGIGAGLGGAAGLHIVHVNAEDDDIIPNHVPTVANANAPLLLNSVSRGRGGAVGPSTTSSSYFNPYDIAAHNQQQRKAGGHAARRDALGLGPAGGGINNASSPAATSPAAGSAAAAPAAAGRGRGRGRGRGAAAAAAAAASDNNNSANSSALTPPRSHHAAAGATSAMLSAAVGGNNSVGLTLGREQNSNGGGGGGDNMNMLMMMPPPPPAMSDTQQAIDSIFDVDNLY